MKITTVGLDIAKSIFHFFGVNQVGKLVRKKALKRSEVKQFFSNLEPCTVVMESCGSANYWARVITALGHNVKLIAPQYVVPYRRKNKNDYNDAEAIAEAAQRANMTFVPAKTIEQQDVQMLIRVRDRYIKTRTKVGNQIRGLLAEYGETINLGRASLKRRLPEILEDAENELSVGAREVFYELYEEYQRIDERLLDYDKKISAVTKNNAICTRLLTVDGIGPITAAALFAAVYDGRNFHNGRHLSAWCGLVPKQHSTGGKNVLLGISKRGNPYIRTLLIHGARSLLNRTENKSDRLSQWAEKLKKEKGYNKACVALANKLARIAWVVMAKGETYRLG